MMMFGQFFEPVQHWVDSASIPSIVAAIAAAAANATVTVAFLFWNVPKI